MRNRILFAALSLSLGAMMFSAGCNSTQVSSGILYQTQDNHLKAVAMFREALYYNSEEAAAHFHLAESLSVLAQDHASNPAELDSARIKLSESHEHFIRAAELKPEQFGVTLDGVEILEDNIKSRYAYYFNGAAERNRSENFDDAIVYFDLAHRMDPRGAAGFNAKNAFVQLSFNRAVAENDEDAVDALLVEMDAMVPANGEQKADLVNTKANALNFRGRTAEAGALFEELLADNPEDLPLLSRVALARIEQGNREGAGELLERVLLLAAADGEVSDDERFGYAQLALINARELERYGDVIRLANLGISFTEEPDDQYLMYFNKSRAYFELEDWQNAIIEAEAAISIEDGKSNIWQVYYVSLARAGRTAESQEARATWSDLRDRE